MKNILTSALIPLLAGLAFGCTSTTALHTSETDDLYYASSDRTVRQEMGTAPAASGQTTYAENSGAANPEYAGSASGEVVNNNYNYYDSGRSFSSRTSFRNYNYYGRDPFYDPFYSPFYSPMGFGAAYCYNMYDPFWYPYCMPSRGVTISFGYGYGFGYPAYGYGGFYGHRPWGYDPFYGGYRGAGGYYRGFYDGYYAGNGYGSGFGNRSRINYAPRNDRGNVPVNAPTTTGGRPAVPGRQVTNPEPGRVGTTPNQPAVSSPAQPMVRPARVNQETDNSPNSPAQLQARPQQDIARPAQPAIRPANANEGRSVQTDDYQFQARPAPEGRPALENRPAIDSRPARPVDRPAIRGNEQPENISSPNQPVQQRERGLFQRPAKSEQQAAPAQPVQRDRGVFQQQARPAQPERPVQREYSQPQRPVQQNNNYNNSRPSSPSSSPAGGFGRPRN